MIIYKATNTINSKVYIGKTGRTLHARKNQHLSDVKIKNGNSYFHRAIRKYGESVFIWEIIDDTCLSEEQLSEMEYHYIKQYNSFGKGGYNLTWGGEGASGHAVSDEARKKISDTLKGHSVSDEARKKISESNKGKVLSAEHRKKVGESGKGRTVSAETRKKMSESNKGKNLGKVHSAETRKKLSDINSKNTYKVESPDGSIDIITNMREYCRKNNLQSSHMCQVAKGKLTHHKGYKCWRIEDEAEALTLPEIMSVPTLPPYMISDNRPLFDVFFGT